MGKGLVALHAVGQELVEDVARLDDPWVDQGVEDGVALAPRGDDLLRPEGRQVLGNVGLGESQQLRQLPDRPLAGVEVVEHHQSPGLGEGLQDLSM